MSLGPLIAISGFGLDVESYVPIQSVPSVTFTKTALTAGAYLRRVDANSSMVISPTIDEWTNQIAILPLYGVAGAVVGAVVDCGTPDIGEYDLLAARQRSFARYYA